MEAVHAKGDVFFTALKTLTKREKEIVLWSIICDRSLRRILENLTDRVIIAEERAKPSRPLRDYIRDREERARKKAKRNHRAIYLIDDQNRIIEVVRVAHRREIYR